MKFIAKNMICPTTKAKITSGGISEHVTHGGLNIWTE
jgi:hypothetical protein